jgi:hypothetical protein
MALNEQSPLNFATQPNAGGASVFYDDQGRLQYGGVPTARGNNFFWRNNDGPNTRSRWSFFPWPWSKPQQVQMAPVTRTRYDDYGVMPGLGYREQTTTVTQQRVTLPPTGNEQLIVEEMKIYDMHPPWWWMFILIGILLIIAGILNYLWCQHLHYYCRFWTGAVLIIFGVLGAIHQGDYYKNKWKSIIYILWGVVTAACVYACICFDLEDFTHQLIEIAQFNDNNAYISEMEFRFTYLTSTPRYVISNDMQNNIWACFAIDGAVLILLTLGFLVITSVIYVIDNFYNSNWIITRLIEPFYAPCTYNPWGQASLGQAMIYIGMVLNGSVHGDNIILWQNFIPPVWAGVFPLVAGVVTALALKSLGLNRRCLNFIAIVLELISAIVSIIALIFVFIGMVQNIQTLMNSWVMNYTQFAQNMMAASSVIYCIAVIICLANVVYSIVLLIRLIWLVCCTPEAQIPVQYIYNDDQAVLAPLNQTSVYTSQQKTAYGGYVNRVVPPNQFVDMLDNPYQAGCEGRTYVCN